jgi:RimJ/RimL family protein N-acetyltransferase
MQGAYGHLEPLDPSAHAEPLYRAFAESSDHGDWTYLAYGPFVNYDEFDRWLNTDCVQDDPLFFAIVDPTTERPVGFASYLRIQPAIGVIEVGHIHYSPNMQRTPLATEAMYLMMSQVFDDLGYRRYEWKCDALNERSRNAALRLGFSFEGIFRQAAVYKGRNRDTAWFSILDSEWPRLKEAYLAWLSPDNHDEKGQHRKNLASFR